jgi:photosystem II stability/assembly factor-like uncharacterized protein
VALKPASNQPKNRWINEISVMDTVIYVCANNSLNGYGPNSLNGFGWHTLQNILSSPFNGQYYSAGRVTSSKIFLGTINGLYTTINSGENWTKVAFGYDSMCVIKSIKTLSGKIFISTCKGIYSSINNGVFWQHLNNGIVGQNYPELVYLSDTLLVGICTYPDKYIYHSTNSGSSWTATSFSLPQPDEVFFGPAVYFKGKVYLSQSKWSHSLGAPVYRTADFGATWDSVSSIHATDYGINCFLPYNNFLFAATDSGVYRSANEGYTWADVSGNLRDSLGVTAMAVYGNQFYAGHRMKGIYKTPINTLVNTKETSSEIPMSFKLEQNFPNPFNPITEISYSLPVKAFTTIKVYDLLGQEVISLINENKEAGTYSLQFDGSSLSSGVYFYKIIAGDFTDTKKMVLIK